MSSIMFAIFLQFDVPYRIHFQALMKIHWVTIAGSLEIHLHCFWLNLFNIAISDRLKWLDHQFLNMVFTPGEFEMNQYMKFSHRFPPMFGTLDWFLVSWHFPLEPCETWDKLGWILVRFKSCFFQNLCGHEQLIQDFLFIFSIREMAVVA